MTLQQWYEKGMNPDEYIESMQTHKESLLHVYDQFSIPNDQEFFDVLKEKQLRVIVLTEDWCGDAMMNVPILLRLTQQANIDVRFLLRDNNLELMDQYLTNGKSRSIPIFIFINEDGQEVAKWGPRAQKVQTFMDESLAGLPDKDSPDFEEKRKELFTFVTKSFRDNTDFWDEVYKSLKKTLEEL